MEGGGGSSSSGSSSVADRLRLDRFRFGPATVMVSVHCVPVRPWFVSGSCSPSSGEVIAYFSLA